MLCVKKLTLLLVAALVLGGVAMAEDTENPYKKAAVGEWVEYKITNTMQGGMKTEMTQKQTVTAKDDSSVTLKMEMAMAGQKMPAQETKIDLTQKYEPGAAKVPNAEVEKLGEGEETITVGGKEYKCKWYNYKTTAKIQGGGSSVSTSKVWICSDVPLNGMVKMTAESETTMPQMTMKSSSSMELTGSGK